MIRKNHEGEFIGIQALEAGDCVGWDESGQTFSAWRHQDPRQLLRWDGGDDKNLQYLNLRQAEGILFFIPELLGLRAKNMKNEYPCYDAVILLMPKE